MSNADLEFLTPGAIFVRKNGKTRTVLCIVNQNLPDNAKVTHPVQVVFLNDKQEMYALPVSQFLSSGVYYSQNNKVAATMEVVLSFDEETIEQEEIIEDPLTFVDTNLSVEATEGLVVQSHPHPVADEDYENSKQTFIGIAATPSLPSNIVNAFRSYAGSLFDEENTLHTLDFDASQVTMEELNSAFMVWENTCVQDIAIVNTATGEVLQQFVLDSSLGIFTKADRHGFYYSVQVASAVEVEEQVVSSEEATEGLVVQSHPHPVADEEVVNLTVGP